MCSPPLFDIASLSVNKSHVLHPDHCILYTWDEPTGKKEFVWFVEGGEDKITTDFTKVGARSPYLCKRACIQVCVCWGERFGRERYVNIRECWGVKINPRWVNSTVGIELTLIFCGAVAVFAQAIQKHKNPYFFMKNDIVHFWEVMS